MNNDDAVKALSNMTVMELISLTKELENKWGLKAAPQVTTTVISDTGPKEEAPTEVSVILASVPPDKKISVIKVLREIANVGLKEAKEFAESAPKPIKEGISREEAELIASKLAEVGAVVEIK